MNDTPKSLLAAVRYFSDPKVCFVNSKARVKCAWSKIISPSLAKARKSQPEPSSKAALLSTYIAYSGPCAIDAAGGSVTLKVEAAWRPDYVGTTQKRFFKFDSGKLIFGPAQGSMKASGEALTRRLTLERVAP